MSKKTTESERGLKAVLLEREKAKEEFLAAKEELDEATKEHTECVAEFRKSQAPGATGEFEAVRDV